MFKLIMTVVLALMLTTSCYAGGYDAEERFNSEYSGDYAFHYGAGAVIGAGTILLIPDDWELTQWEKGLIAVGLAMVVKAAFEVFDDNPDVWDVMEYGAGAAIGGTITLFTIEF